MFPFYFTAYAWFLLSIDLLARKGRIYCRCQVGAGYAYVVTQPAVRLFEHDNQVSVLYQTKKTGVQAAEVVEAGLRARPGQPYGVAPTRAAKLLVFWALGCKIFP